jgi:hypothetical protein
MSELTNLEKQIQDGRNARIKKIESETESAFSEIYKDITKKHHEKKDRVVAYRIADMDFARYTLGIPRFNTDVAVMTRCSCSDNFWDYVQFLSNLDLFKEVQKKFRDVCDLAEPFGIYGLSGRIKVKIPDETTHIDSSVLEEYLGSVKTLEATRNVGDVYLFSNDGFGISALEKHLAENPSINDEIKQGKISTRELLTKLSPENKYDKNCHNTYLLGYKIMDLFKPRSMNIVEGKGEVGKGVETYYKKYELKQL